MSGDEHTDVNGRPPDGEEGGSGDDRLVVLKFVTLIYAAVTLALGSLLDGALVFVGASRSSARSPGSSPTPVGAG